MKAKPDPVRLEPHVFRPCGEPATAVPEVDMLDWADTMPAYFDDVLCETTGSGALEGLEMSEIEDQVLFHYFFG